MRRDSPRLREVFALGVNSLHLRTTQVLACGSIVSAVSCLEGGLWGCCRLRRGQKRRQIQHNSPPLSSIPVTCAQSLLDKISGE